MTTPYSGSEASAEMIGRLQAAVAGCAAADAIRGTSCLFYLLYCRPLIRPCLRAATWERRCGRCWCWRCGSCAWQGATPASARPRTCPRAPQPPVAPCAQPPALTRPSCSVALRMVRTRHLEEPRKTLSLGAVSKSYSCPLLIDNRLWSACYLIRHASMPCYHVSISSHEGICRPRAAWWSAHHLARHALMPCQQCIHQAGVCPAVLGEDSLVEYALRQTLVADAVSLQFRLPPPGVPPPVSRRSPAIAHNTPVVDTLVITSVWAVHLLRTLSQVTAELLAWCLLPRGCKLGEFL